MSVTDDAAVPSTSLTPQRSRLLTAWNIPVQGGAPTEVRAEAGRVTVFVGPNGSGKSALANWLRRNAGGVAFKTIIAHRKVWLHSAGGDITFMQRDSTVSNMAVWDQSPESRWLDHAESYRASIALLDLTALENERNAQVSRRLESGENPDQILTSVPTSPLGQLNSVLSTAGLRVQLQVGREAALKARRTDSGAEYPASEMSDGEKSALLLAAEVLTAPQDSVIVIDEPERHLHRAISAELIRAVLASRPDCHFVLMTHDIDLAVLMQGRGCQVLTVSESTWANGTVEAWAVRAVDADMPEEARLAALGGRAQVLFVEGDEGSLDLALYRLLFPEWSPIPIGSCETVIRSVVGLNQSATVHWITARGIVDRDGRTDEEVAALRQKGVLVLPVSEVESLYYHPEVVAAIAARQAKFLDVSAGDLFQRAIDSAITALRESGVTQRLARNASIQILSRRVVDAIPGRDLIAAGPRVGLEVANPYVETLQLIERALARNDFAELVRIAPIRESRAFACIREPLRLPRKLDYGAAVRTTLADDIDLRARVAALLGTLP